MTRSAFPVAAWPDITNDVRQAFADHDIKGGTPIAITEHNLVASIDNDDEQLMAQAVNAFYLAETIGQMAVNGVTIADQWNFANGRERAALTTASSTCRLINAAPRTTRWQCGHASETSS